MDTNTQKNTRNDFTHIQSVLADMYCNVDTEFAAIATIALQDKYGVPIIIDTMNSGYSTEFENGDIFGRADYEYKFDDNDCLSEIQITPEDAPVAKWSIKASDEMIELYRKIMAYSRLMNEVGDLNSLNDKAISEFDG